MRQRVDPASFSEQMQRLRLRFCCEDCAFFDDQAHRCAHGWPTADHRKRRYSDQRQTEIVFCKEFELR